MRLAVICLAVCSAAPVVVAQQTVPEQRDAINWARGVRDRFRQMRTEVTRTYGLAALAAAVCGLDRDLGGEILTEAVRGVNDVPDAVFLEVRSQVLPVASLHGLWKAVTDAAAKCDPTIAQPNQRLKERLAEERRKANQF